MGVLLGMMPGKESISGHGFSSPTSSNFDNSDESRNSTDAPNNIISTRLPFRADQRLVEPKLYTDTWTTLPYTDNGSSSCDDESLNKSRPTTIEDLKQLIKNNYDAIKDNAEVSCRAISDMVALVHVLQTTIN